MLPYAWAPLIGLGRHLAHRGPTYRLATYDMGGPKELIFGVSSNPDALPLHAYPYNKPPFLKMASGVPSPCNQHANLQMREHRLWEVSEESHTSRKWRS